MYFDIERAHAAGSQCHVHEDVCDPLRSAFRVRLRPGYWLTLKSEKGPSCTPGASFPEQVLYPDFGDIHRDLHTDFQTVHVPADRAKLRIDPRLPIPQFV